MTGAARGILFRSYLVIVGGLIVVSVVLDAGFASLQEERPDTFLASSFRLIEEQAKDVPTEKWPQLASTLSEAIEHRVQILPSTDVVATSQPSPLQALVDDTGRTSYLFRSSELGAAIMIGPIQDARDPWWIQGVPPLFYLSIFVVVGLWLRPVLKDLNLITAASQQFADDYREPLVTASKATQLRALARNLDEMSARISRLIQSQKELSAALSHEMRTPLARIRMAMAVLSNKADPSTQRSLQEVGDDIQEIDELIGSMLSYARLDHPDTRMSWQSVPPREWAGQVVARSKAAEKAVVLSCEPDGQGVWMDARLMEIALSNLIVNALRYAETRVEVGFGSADGCNRLTVEDDGEGIPPDELETVFKAFKRLDSSRNRDTGGFGLGLAIVSRIAELHGGSAAAARSERLGGAAFTISWPMEAYAAEVREMTTSL